MKKLIHFMCVEIAMVLFVGHVRRVATPNIGNFNPESKKEFYASGKQNRVLHAKCMDKFW